MKEGWIRILVELKWLILLLAIKDGDLLGQGPFAGWGFRRLIQEVYLQHQ